MDDRRRKYIEIQGKRKYICVKNCNLGKRRSEQQRTGKSEKDTKIDHYSVALIYYIKELKKKQSKNISMKKNINTFTNRKMSKLQEQD